MPEGYCEQYSLRWNLVSLGNGELFQKTSVFVLKTKQKVLYT